LNQLEAYAFEESVMDNGTMCGHEHKWPMFPLFKLKDDEASNMPSSLSQVFCEAHLESCTPGQDWANRYILVRTSTCWYNMVQGSTRISRSYVQVCTGTYQYVHSRRHVVS